MTKSILRNILLTIALIGGFIMMDLSIDRIVTGDTINITHLIPAVMALLISYFLLRRALSVRKRAEGEQHRAYDDLETRVAERTAELELANQSLHTEIGERKQAEQEREQLLAQAEVARQRAEDLAHELQLANRMLNALIETLPTGMVIVDADSEIVLANQRVKDIMGNALAGARSSLSADSRLCRMDGTPFPLEEMPLNRAVQAGETTTGAEVCLCQDDGSKTFLLIAASPIRDESGHITSAVEIVQDITDLKQMTQAMRESENTSRVLMDSLSESAVLTDTVGNVLASNEIAAKRLGTTVAQLVGSSLFDFFPPDLVVRRKAYLAQALETCQPVHAVDVRDGRTFDNYIHPVFNMDGAIVRLAIFGQDVTESIIAEQTLRASEEKFATVFHHSPDLIAIARLADGVFLDVNEAFTKLLGYSRSEVLGKSWMELDFIPAADEYSLVIDLFQKKGTVADYELNFITKDKQVATLLVSLITITVSAEACFLAIAHDITLRKLSEKALRKVQAELALDIQKRTAMEERQRLARELHDSVSQALYGISLGTHTALTLFETDRVRVLEALNYVLSLAQAGLTEMRALIFELRPESLELEGLVIALTKQSAALAARHGIEVELNLCIEPDVSITIKEVIYRIAQEALHNAVKHARPVRMDVRLIYEQGCLRLEVCDNGIGFDAMAAFPGHLGLRSMRERAVSVGGTLEIISAPDCGTQIRVYIPLSKSEES